MSTIYELSKRKGINAKHVVEVGVWFPSDSQCIPFIKDGCRVQLFEPLEEAISKIIKLDLNCELHQVGIYDFDGESNFIIPSQNTSCASGSSYIEGVKSPDVANRGETHLKKRTIQVRTFDHYDDGTIDVLALDCEGCEWFVLKNMKSKPQLVSIEIGDEVRPYVNPYKDEIVNWFNINNYILISKSSTDWIYEKMKKYEITLIGGIGNILQTAPFMQWLKNNGYKVFAKIHKDAFSREICEILSPAYHQLIEDTSMPNAVSKGSILATDEGKLLVKDMSEWKAWFKFHGFEPPDKVEIDLEFPKAKSPSRVVFAPCCKSNWPMKRWPHWNQLIEKMTGCTVVGLPTDGDNLEGDFIDLRGKTTLTELAGILADADYVVAEEGGIAHLACAVGTKTYILYGGTDPVKNCPPDNAIQIMTSESFNCQPCQGRTLYREGDWDKGNEMFYGCKKQDMINGYTRCMNSLTSFEVMKAIADNGDGLNISRNRPKVCFLCGTDAGYYHFVIPHLLSALLTVPDSVAEALVINMKSFMDRYGESYNIMKRMFGDRVLIRQVPFPTHPHLCRFVYEPQLKAEYTYIGDVDIITLERDLMNVHMKHMRENNVCYSNRKRPNNDHALTGLHCVDTDVYYKKTRSFRNKLKEPNAWRYVMDRRTISSYDELVLHDIVYKNFTDEEICNLPIPRPVHGIHVSMNRPASAWNIDEWYKEYQNIKEIKEWKELIPLMGDEFHTVMNRIEQEIENRIKQV